MLASVVLAGRGDDARVIGAPTADAPATDVAQYIVHMSVDAPDGRVNHFVPTSSLADDGLHR